MTFAQIMVRRRDAGIYLFEWQGPEDALVMISREFMTDRLVGLIPWPLVQVGETWRGDGVFRRRGGWQVRWAWLRWRLSVLLRRVILDR